MQRIKETTCGVERRCGGAPSACPRVRWSVLLSTLLVSALPALGQDLSRRIEASFNRRAALAESAVSVRVSSIENGRLAASFDDPGANGDGRRTLIPASNMKLLTTGAALLTLGPDYQFETTLLLDGDRLILRGGGDPAFGDPALLRRSEPRMSTGELLERLAAAVEEVGGVDRVSEIIADDRVFDREWTHPSWPRDQLNRSYAAEVAGVSFHTNVMTVVVRPSSLGAGNPPSYTLEPLPDSRATWIEMENDATTSARQRSAISVFRPTPANRFRLAGRVGLGSPAAADVAIHEPPTFAANLLATYLSARGIRVGRGNEPSDAVRLAREDERFDGAREIARVTTSMANVLRRTNADSQNLYAESLFKLIAHESTGAPGSFAGGAAVVRMLLNGRLGASHAAATRIAEGSGLSRENLVSADTMAQWLAVVARDEAAGPAMFASLPSVGEGTLRSRFRDRRPQNAVLAKSGTIRGVRCLSGYVIGARGHTSVAFSILCNDLNDGRSIEAALRFHEDTVLAIDEWVTAQEKDALGRVGG